ncbi:MAG: MFS transporter [Deltaproteobacteria bacterium]|nr:MFS transporter [Deltaproteobacteria bacterium]
MTKNKPSIPPLVYVLALAQFAAPFMFSGVGVSLPAMGKELHAGAVELGLIETIYLGAASAFLLPVGRFADLTDKNFILKVGIFTYALSTLIIGLLSSIPAIIVFRFIQGLSGALVMATNMAIITDITPGEKLGKAIGMNIGAVYMGLSAGPFVSGWLTTNYGWRWVYHGAFIPLILSYILIQVSLKSKWKAPDRPFDWPGTVMIVTSLFLLIFGGAMLGESKLGYLLCTAGIVMVGLFFIIEKRLSHSLLKFSEIKNNSTLSIALVIQLFMYAGAFGITFLFSLYLQTVKGFSPQSAGQILVVSPIIMAIFAPICGRLADNFPPKILTSLGLGSNLVCALLASQVSDHTGLTYIVGVLVFQGLGFAMFSSPNMTIIMNSVTPKEYGLASALSAKMRSLGMVLSMMVITVFISIYMGKHMIDTHSAEYLSVMRSSFIIFAIFAGGGTWLSLMRSGGHSGLGLSQRPNIKE